MSVSLQLSLLVLLSGCCVVRSEQEKFSATMDSFEKFNVSWSVDADVELSSRDITFTIRCVTSGWVGIGLSPNGGMAGADIIIAWVDAYGKGHLKDMHATRNALPLEDDSQDANLISYSEQNGVTMITFTRKINTCDEIGDNVIVTSTTRMIYAYGAKDPTGNVLSQSDYHGSTNRGVKSVYLLDPQTQPKEEPSNTAYFDLLISNYAVRPEETTYYCAFFDPPALDTKHHIISAESVIQEGNEGLIHHMVVYACWGMEQEHIRNNNKTEGVCYTDEMPEFFSSCRNVVASWAIGGTRFYYPDNAGVPIGSDDGSSAEYYMLQLHYDNRNQLNSWVDSSGMRLTYTPDLRSNDVGIATIGMIIGIVVPPHPDKFRVEAYCSSDCTNRWIPEEGIHVFAYLLHAHLLGVGIQVDLYRDGKPFGVFASDVSYDFNFQDIRPFSRPKKVLPGDTLKITCIYSDTSRDRVTYGGLGSGDEMCVSFLLYYPMVNVAHCRTEPAFLYSAEETVYTKLSLNATNADGSVNLHVLDDVTDWTEEAVGVMHEAYEVSDHISYCIEKSGKPFKDSSNRMSSAAFPTIQEEADNSCVLRMSSGADVAHLNFAILFVFTFLLTEDSMW